VGAQPGMGWRQVLWSSESVITEMSVSRKGRRRGHKGGGLRKRTKIKIGE